MCNLSIILFTIYLVNKMMHQKPLYQAQKQIEYKKHLQRLKNISKKKINTQIHENSKSIQVMHRARNQSAKFQMKERQSLLDFQNNKILNKIIGIAERKDMKAYQTIPSHYVPKKQSSIIIFDNPERKRRQQQIFEQNNKLARRLLTKNSQFDRQKMFRDINEYQKVKNTMKNNRRVKLIPVKRGDNLGFDFARVSTVENSRAQINESDNNQILDKSIYQTAYLKNKKEARHFKQKHQNSQIDEIN